MSTKMDFYIGMGDSLEWLGSYRGGGEWIFYHDGRVGRLKSEDEYLSEVQNMDEDGVLYTPAREGWPWSWDDSSISDYACTWADGQLFISSGPGTTWMTRDEFVTWSEDGDYDNPPGIPVKFPSMAEWVKAGPILEMWR